MGQKSIKKQKGCQKNRRQKKFRIKNGVLAPKSVLTAELFLTTFPFFDGFLTHISRALGSLAPNSFCEQIFASRSHFICGDKRIHEFREQRENNGVGGNIFSSCTKVVPKNLGMIVT